MNNKVVNVLMFATGAAIGSVVTWKLVKTKYEQIARDEIASVKEVFSFRKSEPEVLEPKKLELETEDKDEDEESDPCEVERDEYKGLLKNYGYTDTEDEDDKKGGSYTVAAPYVITPDEFGGEYEYDAISLNYYADGILADDWGVIIDDVDGEVGIESLDHFGQYQADTVFVRNDRLKIDYEIIRDERSYSDVHDVPQHPEDE